MSLKLGQSDGALSKTRRSNRHGSPFAVPPLPFSSHPGPLILPDEMPSRSHYNLLGKYLRKIEEKTSGFLSEYIYNSQLAFPRPLFPFFLSCHKDNQKWYDIANFPQTPHKPCNNYTVVHSLRSLRERPCQTTLAGPWSSGVQQSE